VRPAYACAVEPVQHPAELVPEAELIVIGEVIALDSESAELRPEAFLKGPASGETIRLPRMPSDCADAPLELNERAMVFVYDADSPRFPQTNAAFVLRDGHAEMVGVPEVSEIQLTSEVRSATGQYIAIATSPDEGAGIDWRNTVIPLGVALAIIFGIGLVLMRVWHRIDPS
jgi:hypothetical protein